MPRQARTLSESGYMHLIVRGIGKQRINTKYIQFIESGIEEVLRDERSEMELSLAKERADALYEKIIGCNGLTAITIFDEEYPEPLKIMKAKTADAERKIRNSLCNEKTRSRDWCCGKRFKMVY